MSFNFVLNFLEYTIVFLTPNLIAFGLKANDFENLLDEYLGFSIMMPNPIKH